MKSGDVKFNVTNDGSQTHSFVVAKTKLSPLALPTDGSGNVDQQGAGLKVIGEIPDIAAGKSASKTFKLASGTYVLFCNVKGHYKDAKAAEASGFIVF